jgi:hypothetical protein
MLKKDKEIREREKQGGWCTFGQAQSSPCPLTARQLHFFFFFFHPSKKISFPWLRG